MDLASGRRLRTRVAGIFLLLPLLARLRVDQIVQRAGYPGSQMVPATSALLSLLALKLLDKGRRSHISDFNFDEALGLFAGLNVLPKATFATDYSYRTRRRHQQQLLAGWISALAPLLFPQGKIFALDFHAIPFRGDPAALDNHFLPRRGKAGPSVLSFFAQESESRVLCYANANLTRVDQPGELMRFVEFWRGLTHGQRTLICLNSRGFCKKRYEKTPFDEASVSGTKTCTEFTGDVSQTRNASADWSRSIQRDGRTDGCILATRPGRAS